MSDQGVREIQLSGKQLVFLFMATVVVAVTVFLLGVSVGRGVRQATTPELQAAADPAVPATAAPVEMPPPTEMTPADTRYSQLDQPEGRSTAIQAAPPAATEATPVDEPLPEQPPASAAKPPVPSPAVATSPPAKKSAEAAELPRASANGQWVVQINAYRSRESADREVAGLKKKGYPAFVLSGGTSFYRVRVGPFRDKPDADRTAARLTKEGFSPLVTR
jgi:DedD protein